VDRLLDEGANPDEKALMGHSPLIMATRSDYTLIAEHLLKAGADPDQKDNLGWAPLHHAVKTDNANLDMISILARHSADVNVRDKHLRTPLHRAAQFGHVQAVQLILRLGANPNAEDENGWTPLDRGRTHPAIVRILEANN
ncbi:ankyrin repeat domain-containing protein, partial [bacterium]|nr:ankyrin repeat domain-containing protein [bacterium]